MFLILPSALFLLRPFVAWVSKGPDIATFGLIDGTGNGSDNAGIHMLQAGHYNAITWASWCLKSSTTRPSVCSDLKHQITALLAFVSGTNMTSGFSSQRSCIVHCGKHFHVITMFFFYVFVKNGFNWDAFRSKACHFKCSHIIRVTSKFF